MSRWSEPIALEAADGRRVELVTCGDCGATIASDPDDGQAGKAAKRRHIAWHDGLHEALTGP